MTKRRTFRILTGAAVLVAVAAIGIFLGKLVSSYELRFFLNREFCGEYRGIDVYKSGAIDKENCVSFIYTLEAIPEELTECCDTLYFTAEDLSLPIYDGRNKALGLTQDSTIYISTEYFSEEVYPHVPDAIWCYEFDPSKKESATNKEKQGAEFPFTRFFYEYKAPEAADDLLAQFMELEKSLTAKIAQL